MSVTKPDLTDRELLAAQIELLETENDRLRRALSEAQRTKYRRAARSLAVIGVVALIGGVIFPVARTVLLALGGTGVFAAVLVVYLTPERFVSATVGERVYEALAIDHAALIEELDLRSDRVYVPIETATSKTVRLFVPQHTEYDLPDDDELDSLFVTPQVERERGVAFEPTGRALAEELAETVRGGFAEEVAALGGQIADGLVETFELVDQASAEADPENGRLSIVVADSAYGPVDRFDHPVASLTAATLAAELGTPVTLEVDANDEKFVVTCRWAQ
jgi:hypothetical protein